MTTFVDDNGNEANVRARLLETLKDRLLTGAGQRPLYPANYGADLRRYVGSPRDEDKARSEILRALNGASALTVLTLAVRPGRRAQVDITARSPLAPGGFIAEVSV